MKHVMLDLETLGTTGLPILLSVGAVRFDPAGHEVEEPGDGQSYLENLPSDFPWLFRQVSPTSCLQYGAIMDDAALAWWADPAQNTARALSFPNAGQNPDTIIQIVFALQHWLNPPPKLESLNQFQIAWSHGAGFDLAILRRYFEKMGQTWPIDHRAERDTRTLYALAWPDGPPPEIVTPPRFVAHHPAWDAWRQARLVQMALRVLGR